MNPLLLCDYYKTEHYKQYPENTTMIYSNLTPRKSRMKGVDKVVVFGIQHFIKEYLINKFNQDFFYWEDRDYFRHDLEQLTLLREGIISEYKRHINVDTKHLEALWDLGYLPIEIKALPEGSLCPIGVPMLTIRNTHPDFYWLTNYLETLMSCMLWQPMTSATIAHEYKKLLTKYAKETDEKNVEFVNWQGHDFSMRGMSSVESAILSGMGHLTSFTGTDTIPAIYQLEDSYNATGLIGASVPATEHSVMCMGTKDDEIGTLHRLMNIYLEGILSIVSDTWDLWKLITEYLPTLKEQILSRNGKLVIRPDSGDPVDIICGKSSWYENSLKPYEEWIEDKMKIQLQHCKKGNYSSKNEYKGVIELLWDIFGGTTNEQGYKVLDSHIGAIYGDSITLDRAEQICERLKAKGFASTNIVLGIGSYTYQYNTRDTFGFAMKATYGEITHKCRPDEMPKNKNCECDELVNDSQYTFNDEYGSCKACQDYIESREIFKDPITDDGTKKSAKGLLSVRQIGKDLELVQQCDWSGEKVGCLETVFKDGHLIKQVTLEEIRKRINEQ